jgi:predicted nucleotidyltransferase
MDIVTLPVDDLAIGNNSSTTDIVAENPDEWTAVEGRKKKNRKQQRVPPSSSSSSSPSTMKMAPNVERSILDRNWIVETLAVTLEPYSPYAIFLYGSYSQGRATAASDVDVMVLWKKRVPELAKLHVIRAKLEEALGKSVDLVAMLYTDRMIDLDEFDNFIDNVYTDAVSVKGDREAIMLSQKMYKV